SSSWLPVQPHRLRPSNLRSPPFPNQKKGGATENVSFERRPRISGLLLRKKPPVKEAFYFRAKATACAAPNLPTSSHGKGALRLRSGQAFSSRATWFDATTRL